MLQDLRLSEEVVEKLHKADQRFCGSADQVLARLRGTLFYDKSACKALDDLSALLKCLRVWLVEPVTIDVLMPPSECYYTDLFFQVKYYNLASSDLFSLQSFAVHFIVHTYLGREPYFIPCPEN